VQRPHVQGKAFAFVEGQSRDHWFAIRKADDGGAGAPCEKN